MYPLGHTEPTLTMRVYQHALDMGGAAVETLARVLGCTLDYLLHGKQVVKYWFDPDIACIWSGSRCWESFCDSSVFTGRSRGFVHPRGTGGLNRVPARDCAWQRARPDGRVSSGMEGGRAHGDVQISVRVRARQSQ
jgi:hypothetical protein